MQYSRATNPLEGVLSNDDGLDMTVIVPVLNEEANIQEMYTRLTTVLEGCVDSHEILFVDDGSWDRSYEILKELNAQDPRVKAIKFSRNFGQHPALSAGLRIARGRMIVSIDGDLQNPPEEIPKLMEKFKEGYEVVYGHRAQRRDPLYRRFASWLLFKLLAYTSLAKMLPKDVTFSACSSSFRILSHDIVKVLNRFEERTRFLAGMTTWLGFKSASVVVNHAARERGTSKYGLLKLIMMAFDSITGFTSFPLKLASAAGLALSTGAFLYTAYLIVARILFGVTADVEGILVILLSVCFLGGVQLLFLGILGEYMARVYQEVQGRPLFVIDRVLGEGEGDLERLTDTRAGGNPYAGSRPAEHAHD